MDNPNSGGGFPWGMGQPGTREIVRRTERDEIGADDARGGRIIALNIIAVCVVLCSTLLIGPFVIVLSVTSIIIAIAYWLVGWPWEIHADVSGHDASVAWIVSVALSATWLFVVDNWIWEYIAAWYPIRWIAPLWLIVPLWIICAAALYGLRDLREAHRRSLFNRNWPPVFEPMPWNVGPYFNDYHYQSENDEYPPAQIIEVPRIINRYDASNPNPNGNHLQERLTAASEQQHKTPPEPITDRFVAPGGRTVRVSDLNEFVLDGVVVGATFKTWHKRKGYSEEYWQALSETCAQHGIISKSGPRSRTRFLIQSRHEAAAALDNLWSHVFPPPHPPTTQSVGDENVGDV